MPQPTTSDGVTRNISDGIQILEVKSNTNISIDACQRLVYVYLLGDCY